MWVTEALLLEDPPPTDWVVEPSAGDGAIAVMLLHHGYRVWANEVREECRKDLVNDDTPLDRVTFQNWTTTNVNRIMADCAFSIVMNPPYRPGDVGLRHVAHALLSNASYVAALLPLAWFSGTDARRRFYAQHGMPTSLYGFLERPKFSGSGGQFEVAWFVWRRNAFGHIAGGLKLLGRPA